MTEDIGVPNDGRLDALSGIDSVAPASALPGADILAARCGPAAAGKVTDTTLTGELWGNA